VQVGVNSGNREKSPNGTRAESKLVGVNSRNRGKFPNRTGQGSKLVGVKTWK
jgi:hypothetical protein